MTAYVRKVPHEETHAPQQLAALFDHLVGAQQERFRYREASALAALRLMTSSNLVGVSTGSSLGRARRRILSIKNRGRTMKQASLRPESYTKKVALVLQGGGALGSYQTGVYEALASSDYKPDWVAGISIGAINAALIAGNSPEMRVEKLREFWRTITTSVNGAGLPLDLGKQISAMRALMFGQSNFFAPRKPTDWWFGDTPTSYYDTSSLKSTLERLFG